MEGWKWTSKQIQDAELNVFIGPGTLELISQITDKHIRHQGQMFGNDPHPFLGGSQHIPYPVKLQDHQGVKGDAFLHFHNLKMKQFMPQKMNVQLVAELQSYKEEVVQLTIQVEQLKVQIRNSGLVSKVYEQYEEGAKHYETIKKRLFTPREMGVKDED